MIYAHASIIYAPTHQAQFPPLLGRMNVQVPPDALLLDLAVTIRLNVESLFREISRDWKLRHAGTARHQFQPLVVPFIKVVVDTDEPVLRGLITTAFRNAGISVWRPEA